MSKGALTKVSVPPADARRGLWENGGGRGGSRVSARACVMALDPPFLACSGLMAVVSISGWDVVVSSRACRTNSENMSVSLSGCSALEGVSGDCMTSVEVPSEKLGKTPGSLRGGIERYRPREDGVSGEFRGSASEAIRCAAGVGWSSSLRPTKSLGEGGRGDGARGCTGSAEAELGEVLS